MGQRSVPLPFIPVATPRGAPPHTGSPTFKNQLVCVITKRKNCCVPLHYCNYVSPRNFILTPTVYTSKEKSILKINEKIEDVGLTED